MPPVPGVVVRPPVPGVVVVPPVPVGVPVRSQSGTASMQVTMTALAREAPGASGLGCFRRRMAFAYAQEQGLRQRLITPAALERALTPAAAAVA